jgi:antitoxin HicB
MRRFKGRVGRLHRKPPGRAAAVESFGAARVRKADLARRLGCHMRQVDRLLDLRHASRLDQIEAAFAALHKRVVIEIRDAA